jgi:hypothetical protein
MPLQSLKVQDIISIVQPGDILAFSGKGNIISDLVRFATGSIVSHVGMILNSQLGTDQPKIIESTSLGGFSGVTVTDLIMRCTYYPGLIWYLPLNADLQKKVDSKKLDYWLLQQKGKQYDTWGAVESALLQWEESDYWHKLVSYWPAIASKSDSKTPVPHWFCSELASAALQQVGILPPSLNPDLVRPTDLVSMQIYSGTCYQLKGNATPIPEYNSIPLKSEEIFQTALVSKKPEAIFAGAQVFEGLGASNKAKALYQHVSEIQLGASIRAHKILYTIGMLTGLFFLYRLVAPKLFSTFRGIETP